MPISFVARPVVLAVSKPKRCGSTGDRRCIPKAIAVSGKSFTNASAAAYGGPGAAIARPQTLAKVNQRYKVGLIS